MMRTEDLYRPTRIKALKYPLHDTPHATIEINRNCNIQCRSCYNLSREYVKSLDEVKKEIDLILKKRNLSVLTILGGEPTLHSDLANIVAYVKSKKLICQLLTNGIVLLQDKNDQLLNELIRSGVDKILLHIDIGQIHVHGDIEQIRNTMFTKLEEKKVNFSLSITIYNDYTCMIPALVKEYSRYNFFDGVLAVLARDPLPPKTQDAELYDEYRSIYEKLGIEPIAYIPSSMDDDSIHWLIYFYFINAHTGKTFGISPFLNRIGRKIYRWSKGRHLFAIKPHLFLSPLCFFLLGLIDSVLHPKKIVCFFKMLLPILQSKMIRFHYIAIQTPPEVDEEKNIVNLCYHCPDATIRNGKLTPVCIADFINPLDGIKNGHYSEDLFQAAYAHLEEL